MGRISFDIDALRGFVAGMELGSFARAAGCLGRSTSAISAQLKKLEEQAGVPLVRKSGRGLVLTPQGEILFAYARRLLDLNDEAAGALRGAGLQGHVRLGIQEDFGEGVLTKALGAFARTHPGVRIEAKVARNAQLLDLVRTRQLDLALAWDAGSPIPNGRVVAELPLRWIGRDEPPPLPAGEPLPLVAFEAPCLMRELATQALDQAGIPWRLAFTSSSLAGIWAAVGAGLGVTVRTRAGCPKELRALDSLPGLPGLRLLSIRAVPEPAEPVKVLESILVDELAPLVAG